MRSTLRRRLPSSLGTGQVEVAKHMSRGLLALVPIFAGCSSPFLDSLSVLLHEARPPWCSSNDWDANVPALPWVLQWPSHATYVGIRASWRTRNRQTRSASQPIF